MKREVEFGYKGSRTPLSLVRLDPADKARRSPPLLPSLGSTHARREHGRSAPSLPLVSVSAEGQQATRASSVLPLVRRTAQPAEPFAPSPPSAPATEPNSSFCLLDSRRQTHASRTARHLPLLLTHAAGTEHQPISSLLFDRSYRAKPHASLLLSARRTGKARTNASLSSVSAERHSRVEPPPLVFVSSVRTEPHRTSNSRTLRHFSSPRFNRAQPNHHCSLPLLRLPTVAEVFYSSESCCAKALHKNLHTFVFPEFRKSPWLHDLLRVDKQS